MRLTGRASAIRSMSGFTLVELLVTLAVITIVLTVAAPGFADLMRRNEASTLVNDFVYALRLARSESVTEGMPTAVCASSNMASCAGNNDWETGWLVFQDPNGDGDCTNAGDGVCDDDGGDVLLAHDPDQEDFTFFANGTPQYGDVGYDANGYAMNQQSTFTLCDDRGRADARGVQLTSGGQIHSAKPGDLGSCS